MSTYDFVPKQMLACQQGWLASINNTLSKQIFIHPKQQQKPITKPTLACQQGWLASINDTLSKQKLYSYTPKATTKTNHQTNTCMPAKLARKYHQKTTKHKQITKPPLACQQGWLASITKKQQKTSQSPNHHLHASKAGSQASTNIYILNDKAKSSSQTSHISFLLLQWAQLQDAMISNLF